MAVPQLTPTTSAERLPAPLGNHQHSAGVCWWKGCPMQQTLVPLAFSVRRCKVIIDVFPAHVLRSGQFPIEYIFSFCVQRAFYKTKQLYTALGDPDF